MNASLRPHHAATDDPILVIDIGGTNVKFGYTLGDRPMDYRKLIASDGLKRGDAVAALAAMVDVVVSETRVQPAAVVAAIPGYVDSDFDRVLTAPNVSGLEDRQVATDLAALIGCPVYLERDSILALMGEIQAGAAMGCDHVMGIFFGTGIGGAFISQGKPFRGTGWALEIGLLPFMAQGRRLEGLRDDCLEAYASGRALQIIAQRHAVAIHDVFASGAHNAALQKDLDDFVLYQALSVGVGVAMMSPATVLLGGGVLEMNGYPRSKLVGLIDQYAPVSETHRVLDLRWSEQGWGAVLHGAPAVVEEQRRDSRAHLSDTAVVAAR